MRLPLSWIQHHLPLDKSPEEMAERLTTLGLEVDKILHEGGETLFEISLTPNLGHALSLLGIVRELKAAFFETPLHPASIRPVALKGDPSLGFKVEVSAPVPLYSLRRVRALQRGEMPKKLQSWLKASGYSLIHPVVDVMNFVMMELGQPLHAFDADEIVGKMEVRYARDKELFEGLDGKEYRLSTHHLVIADEEKVLALAGILGGKRGSVTEETTEILIEAAHFDPKAVRKASRELGISTEASRRFERGIDPLGILRAQERAVMLLEEHLGFGGASEPLVIESVPYKPRSIRCRLKRIETLLGVHLGVEEVSAIWERLEISFEWDGKESFTVTPPSYRNDLHEEIDLIEEVARLIGLDNIPRRETSFSLSSLSHAPAFLLERETRRILLSLGLQEWMNCDLIDPKKLKALLKAEELPGETLRVLNPSSEEEALLRPSLLPGLLLSAKRNLHLGTLHLQAFEIGKIHFKVGEQLKEELVAGILLTGARAKPGWGAGKEEVDFFDLKGIAEALFEGLEIQGVSYKEHQHSLFHPGRQAVLLADQLQLGMMGELHPSLLRELDLTQRVYLLEINLHELYALKKPKEKMDPLPLFPSSTRDWTVTLDRHFLYSSLEKEIEKTRPQHLESFHLKDIFRSEKLGEGRQNLTLHFVYRGTKETLSQERVDEEHFSLINQLTKFLFGSEPVALG